MAPFPSRITRNILKFAAVLLLCGAALSHGQTQALPPITPIEAVHLAEGKVPRLATSVVRNGVDGGSAVYIVEGMVKEDGYRAVVDAQAARVLRVTKNGEPFYEWQGVTVIAHRGASRFAPENTIAAFEKAIARGADLIEIDIRETKDGHLVVMHDVTVDRTTNGSGAVAGLTLAEIKQLDAGSSFSFEFKGEKIPTLDEALEAMKGRALPDLDFKAGTPEKLVDAVRRHDLLGKVTLYAGDYELLRRTLAISKEFHARPSIHIGRAGLPMLLKELNPPIVNIDWREFSEGLIRDVHVSGRQAFVNVMGPNDNEFGILAAIDAGADFIQSDRLDILVPLLRSRGLQRRPAGRLVSQR